MNGAAVVGSMSERAKLALAAVCNDRPAAIALINDLKDLKPSPARSRRLEKVYRTEGPR